MQFTTHGFLNIGTQKLQSSSRRGIAYKQHILFLHIITKNYCRQNYVIQEKCSIMLSYFLHYEVNDNCPSNIKIYQIIKIFR